MPAVAQPADSTLLQTRTINVKVPVSVFNQLNELATATARTKSLVVVEAPGIICDHKSGKSKKRRMPWPRQTVATLPLTNRSTPSIQNMTLESGWTNSTLRRLDIIATDITADSPVRAKAFTQELRKKSDALKSQKIGTADKVFSTRQYLLNLNFIAIYSQRKLNK